MPQSLPSRYDPRIQDRYRWPRPPRGWPIPDAAEYRDPLPHYFALQHGEVRARPVPPAVRFNIKGEIV